MTIAFAELSKTARVVAAADVVLLLHPRLLRLRGVGVEVIKVETIGLLLLLLLLLMEPLLLL